MHSEFESEISEDVLVASKVAIATAFLAAEWFEHAVDKILVFDLVPVNARFARVVLVLKLRGPSEFGVFLRDQMINTMLESCSFLRPELITILDSSGRKLSAIPVDGEFPKVAICGVLPPSG